MQLRSNQQRKKSRKPVIIAAVAVIAVIAAALLAAGTAGKQAAVFAVDDKAVTGDLSGMSREEIQEQLQQAADASMFSFKINSRVEFETGSAEGNLMIGNPAANAYDMRVVITLLGTGESVYETGLIRPGSSIPRDALDEALPAGEYEAEAVIYAHDRETGEELGKTAAGLTITVKE